MRDFDKLNNVLPEGIFNPKNETEFDDAIDQW